MNKVIIGTHVTQEEKDISELNRLNSLADSELMHFGVLGMRWGVRKDRDSGSSLKKKVGKTLEKWDARNAVYHNRKKIVTDALKKSNPEIAKIKKKHELTSKRRVDLYKPKNIPKLEAYYKDVSKILSKSLNNSVKTIVGNQIPSNLSVKFRDDVNYSDLVSIRGPRFEIIDNDIHHAEGDQLSIDGTVFELIIGDDGSILDVEFVDPALMHYGVPGMRWGVRKSDDSESSIRKDRRTALKNRRSLSDEELTNRTNRLQKEKRYKELAEEDLRPGKQATSKFVGKYGGIALAAAAGIVGSKIADSVMKDPKGLADKIMVRIGDMLIPKTIIGG